MCLHVLALMTAFVKLYLLLHIKSYVLSLITKTRILDSIQISYPDYFIFFIFVIAGLYALSLYVNEKKLAENHRWLPRGLTVLRLLSVFLALFMLLAPLVKSYTSNTENPILVFVEDKSQSISTVTDSLKLADYSEALKSIKEKLSEDFRIENLSFGQNIAIQETDSIDKQSTNISGILEYISDSYEDQNLGAVILKTDGIYNEGKNPLYADIDLQAPLHTIALGDTSQRRDITIKNVLHNRIIYLKDRFVIEADIQAFNAKGSSARVQLLRRVNGQNQSLRSENLNINTDKFFQTIRFELEANEPGNIKYQIAVSPVSNEISTNNNYRNVYIEVLDARQKVLLLANSPHPDIKTIKNNITSSRNYELDVAYAGKSLANTAAYDIVILHNLPSRENPIDIPLEQWTRKKIPLFFIAGAQTDKARFNQVQNIFSISNENFSLNNATPVLDANFSNFSLSDKLKNSIESFVPLKAPFGNYEINSTSKVLLRQKIGSVETPYPLLAYSEVNGHKQAVLAGEGLWRWGLMEYFENETTDRTRELIQKTIQYISQKEDKRQFRAFTNKRDYRENETILFDAQLYNDNYELINTPEVSLQIQNEDGERFDFIFSRNDPYYIVNTGKFPEGNYSFTARTEYNGKNLESSGRFTVQSIEKESYDLTARHGMLAQLSSGNRGQMIYPENISGLDSLIRSDSTIKPVMYQKLETRSLLDKPLFLLIILLLLSMEWFLRRYFGSY